MPTSVATRLAEALLADLDTELGAMGFKRRRRDYTYRREAGPVRQYVHLTIAKDRSLAQVSIDVAVRIHAIEETIDGQEGSSKNSRDRATVGVELGNWTGAGWRSWNLATPEDVAPVRAALVAEFRRVGQPFLERFSSVAEIQQVLSKGGDEARLVCPLRERWPEILSVSRTILAGHGLTST